MSSSNEDPVVEGYRLAREACDAIIEELSADLEGIVIAPERLAQYLLALAGAVSTLVPGDRAPLPLRVPMRGGEGGPGPGDSEGEGGAVPEDGDGAPPGEVHRESVVPVRRVLDDSPEPNEPRAMGADGTLTETGEPVG